MTFNISNGIGPDEMPHIHIGLNCLLCSLYGTPLGINVLIPEMIVEIVK